jgi:uroporphyrinogen decarboxylase
MEQIKMTGKELLLKAVKGEETPRPAWVPFVGAHGGKLINKTATEYLQSAELMVSGLKKAAELYNPDGLPVTFDLQIEAEIMGCELHWADEVPPSVVTHPLEQDGVTTEDLPKIDRTKGRLPIVLSTLDMLKREIGDEVALYGLICGPFTLALHLRGNNIFLDMFDKPDEVKQLIDFCADIGIKMAELYIEHGADVIAVVDPMTSQISPDHFEEFVTPGVNKVFDGIREQGGLSSIFVCGDVTRNLEIMCRTHADNISVDEQIDMNDLRRLCGENDKSFGGNIKLTSVLLLGSEDDARREAVEIMDISGTKGFVLAPGCDLPYNTPPENLAAIADVVHDEYKREIARASQASDDDKYEDIEVTPYHKYKEVVVDVITLDSTSCAPCQYMMEAVERAAADAFVKVYINEHKIKARAGLGMMKKLGVRNLPTICIDGEIAFASIIPDTKTLVKAIEARAIQKNIAALASQ